MHRDNSFKIYAQTFTFTPAEMLKKFTTIIAIFLLNLHVLLAQGFIENQGQWPENFAFKAAIPGGEVYLEDGAILFHLSDPEARQAIHNRQVDADFKVKHHAIRLRFVGSNQGVNITGSDSAKRYVNYYLGDNPANWRTKIHPCFTVTYKSIYDGIDLHVIQKAGALKYEFHLEAGADPTQIKIAAEGADGLSLDRDGHLHILNSLQTLVETKPVSYQYKRDKQYDVASSFEISGNTISYKLGDIDPMLPLVIDPEIVFSTYTGSVSDNWGFTATPDKAGHLFAGGITFGDNYPVSLGAFDASFNQGTCDVAITKFDSSGTDIIYSTYLGGSSIDQPHSMIASDGGILYVMGTTGSNNFPTTAGALDRSFNGGPNISVVYSFPNGADMFVSAFNSTGTQMYASTYLGGTDSDGLNLSSNLAYNYSDEFRGEINLDDEGSVYIASSTYSEDFPHTSGSFDGNYNDGQDAVVLKLNSTLSALQWGGFLGGGGDDAAYGIDIASDGTIYVGGGTSSNGFPTTTGALNTTYRGGRADGFVTRITADGSSILQSTFYGTNAYDQIYFLQLDRDDRPHFFGQTEHAGSQLIFNASYNDPGGGQIIGMLEGDLSARVWTSQFGSTPGQPNISPTAFLVDVCNSLYISGWGGVLNGLGNNNASDVDGLEVTQDAFQSTPDSDDSDFYLAVVAADGSSLIFGSFFGGSITDDHVDGGTSRFDRSGKIYHSVCASCGGFDDFPVEPDPGAYSTQNASNNCNNAAFKIDFELPIIVADFNIPTFACAPYTLNIQNFSVTQSNSSFLWDFGNGFTSTQTNPSVTFNETGTYDVTLVINDPTSCNLSDTLVRTIMIARDTNYQLPDIVLCVGQTAVLGPDPANYDDLSNATISWLPSAGLDNPSLLNPSITINESGLYRLVIDYGGCQERILQQVNIDRFPIEVSDDTILCSNFTPFEIFGTSFGEADTMQWSLDSDFSTLLSEDSVITISTLTKPINNFYFRTIKANGCQMLDTVTITVSNFDIVLTPDTTVCKNQPTRIEARSNNPLNTFTYIWTTNGYSLDTAASIVPTDQNFVEINLSGPQEFFLTALSKKVEGCMAQDSVLVNVSNIDFTAVSATAEVDSFYRGQLVSISGSPSGEGFNYYWSPDLYITDAQAATTTVRPKEKTNYIWTVSDEAYPECTFRDTITLSPYEIVCDTPNIYVPTAFSPDGDGKNDTLKVRGKHIESMQFIVHDRWGNEVFRSSDPKVGWNGNVNGSPADRAVYVYQLDAVCITGQRYYTKGNVTKLK